MMFVATYHVELGTPRTLLPFVAKAPKTGRITHWRCNVPLTGILMMQSLAVGSRKLVELEPEEVTDGKWTSIPKLELHTKNLTSDISKLGESFVVEKGQEVKLEACYSGLVHPSFCLGFVFPYTIEWIYGNAE